MSFTNCDHVFTDTGEGKPILFLHELGSNSICWFQQITFLRQLGGMNIITVDLPGHGEAKSVPERVSLKHSAEVVAEYLSEHSRSEPIVVGHGLGGVLALELAHILQLGGLVLIDTPTKPSCRRFLLERRLKRLSHDFARLIQTQLESVSKDKEIQEAVTRTAKTTPPDVYIAYLKDYLTANHSLFISQMSTPTLAVLTQTLVPKRTNLYRIAKRYRYDKDNIDLKLVDCGHFAMLERASLLSPLLASFFHRLPSRIA